MVGQGSAGDHWLYRCYDATGELYVGITSAGVKRFRNHGNDKGWWPDVDTVRIEHFATREETLDAEVVAIRRERPRHNVDHNGARTNVEHLYRRCQDCRRHFRPAPGYRWKVVCPPCREARDAVKLELDRQGGRV